VRRVVWLLVDELILSSLPRRGVSFRFLRNRWHSNTSFRVTLRYRHTRNINARVSWYAFFSVFWRSWLIVPHCFFRLRLRTQALANQIHWRSLKRLSGSRKARALLQLESVARAVGLYLVCAVLCGTHYDVAPAHICITLSQRTVFCERGF
jgi:hypothetical protein